MTGKSIPSRSGSKVIGKNGTYVIKERIGYGGNGTVYVAEVEKGEKDLPHSEGYVIKFLEYTSEDENEIEKRKMRFKKEIEMVISFQNDISGIIPIYDTSIYTEQDKLWYLMPKAETYKSRIYTVSRKLEHMIQLGNCIKHLHEMGYAHRDIKPKNLLIYEDRVCLSDFGLVWNKNDPEEHITEANDCLGPQAIRPPELQPVEKLDGVDYRESDIYLFAKTIWMILKCNNQGFSAEYSRTEAIKYINREELQLITAEPLHRLMEEATRANHWERCSMDACLTYLEDQLRVANGDIPFETLKEWQYDEQIKHLSGIVPSDEKIYRNQESILQILDGMSGIADLIFADEIKKYSSFPLRNANHISNNLFEIGVLNLYADNSKIIIKLAIDDICIKSDSTCEIHSTKYAFDSKLELVFASITEALLSKKKSVCLNASYSIRLATK